ncbi:MAG: lipocalin family protein [Syntrophales bacterium]
MVKYLLFILLVAIPLFACVARTKLSPPPLQVVSYVDLKKYIGTWYEIARFPNRFQEGCVGTSATYTLLQDGKIGVLNQCHKGTLDGEISSAKGKARVVDKKTNAKLKVSFFWPFSGDYWIIDLGENYEYAVVGYPDRKYLWILSRKPEIDEATYNRILEKLRMQSYDVSKLMKTKQLKEGS